MKPPDSSWRLFIAIELPATLRKQVQDHIDQLKKALPDARASWTREENLHLTIKFLGDTPVNRVEALSQAAARAAAQVSPFEIIIGGCAAFPTRGQPRVLWIGIEDPTGAQNKLYRALEDECAEAGFAREQRPFHPHLTVARLRKPQGSHRVAELYGEMGFTNQQVSVSEMVLFRSEMLSEGSRHSVISRHQLRR